VPLLNAPRSSRDIGMTPNSDRELQPYQRYEGHTGCVEVGKQAAVTNQVRTQNKDTHAYPIGCM